MNSLELIQSLHGLIKESVKSVYELDIDTFVVEHPSNTSFGDLSTNIALVLSNKLHQPPMQIAKILCYEIDSRLPRFSEMLLGHPIFTKVEIASPGFINFVLSNYWDHHVLEEVIKHQESYGSSKIGAGKKILIEFSQPNSNKAQHVGHARNNFIGSSLAEIYSYLGYEVVRANYVGDIGIHICKSLLMYMKYGDGKLPDIKPDHFVGAFYTLFEKESEKNPQLLEEAQELLRKWEAGDKEVISLWQKLNAWVYEGWKSTYTDQNVQFDIWEYESNNISIGKDIVDVAVEKGIAHKDDTGAIVADLESYGLPNKVLLRSDGTSLYITKDLQLAKDGYEKYKFDKRIYVVDGRQGDYFAQLFKILSLLGFEWSNRLYHLSYGWISLPEGKMSSRTGNVVNADEVFQRLIELEKMEVDNSLVKDSISPDVIDKVALSAFRYALLRVDPSKSIIFRYENVTKFEGSTGPYLMYSYARALSVLTRSGFDVSAASYSADGSDVHILSEKETALIRSIGYFGEILHDSSAKMSPHILAEYGFNLCQTFNSFYAIERIIDTNNPILQNFRLTLTFAFAITLKKVLNLLCIPVVERM